MKKYSIKVLLKEEITMPQMALQDFDLGDLGNAYDRLPYPIVDAAGDEIRPGGKSTGYKWEALLKSSIERSRQWIYKNGPDGVAGLEPVIAKARKPTRKNKSKTEIKKTEKWDISLDKSDDTEEIFINDGTGRNRLARLEVKKLPSQFGQFKKRQVKTLEFDGNQVVWTHHDPKSPENADIDFVLGQVNKDCSAFLKTFLAWCNKRMSEEAHTIVGKHFGTELGLPEGTNFLNPFVGNLSKINLKSDIYKQLGEAYSMTGLNYDGLGISEEDAANIWDAGYPWLTEPVGKQIAFYALKNGQVDKDGFVGAPEGAGTSTTVPTQKWKDYMGKVKDAIIFGEDHTKIKGSIFALNSIGQAAGFPLFVFPGANVDLSCRFTADSGGFRMEAQSKINKVPSGGIEFDGDMEFYSILTKFNPTGKDQASLKLSDSLSTTRKQRGYGSVNPNRPLKLDAQGNPTSELQLQHRKRKYSITARLLGKK